MVVAVETPRTAPAAVSAGAGPRPPSWAVTVVQPWRGLSWSHWDSMAAFGWTNPAARSAVASWAARSPAVWAPVSLRVSATFNAKPKAIATEVAAARLACSNAFVAPRGSSTAGEAGVLVGEVLVGEVGEVLVELVGEVLVELVDVLTREVGATGGMVLAAVGCGWAQPVTASTARQATATAP